jgi:hypothetical protein
VAVIVVVPWPTTVTVEPATVATDGSLLVKDTLSPELAVADRAKDGAPTTTEASGPKSICWLPRETTKVPLAVPVKLG